MKLKKSLLCALSPVLLVGSTFIITSCAKNDNGQNPIDPIPPTPTNPNTPYSYEPHLYKKMPIIRIDTQDKNNTFATERKDIYVSDGDDSYDFVKQEFPYQNATITVENLDDNLIRKDLLAQVKVRGNTTTIYDKKPFRIKFTENQEMLSLNNKYAFKDWVLLANWRDVSMLRNNVGLYLGQFLYKDQGLYSSDFVNVELYLNGEYWGVYLLCEQNEVATERVNIEKPVTDYQGTDIGYLLEMDSYAHFEPTLEQIKINYEGESIVSPINTYTIKSKIYNESQRSFIEKYLENIYKIIYRSIVKKECWEFNNDKTDIIKSTTISDPDKALENVVDINSAVSVCILQEIICDYDVNNSSFYMSIDLSPTGDGKLHFQAPWDFDFALGMCEDLPPANISNDYNGSFIEYWYTTNPWLKSLYSSDLIKKLIKDRWAEMKEHSAQDKILRYIDDISNLYVSNYKANYDKWKNIAPYIEEEVKKNENNENPNETANYDDLYYAIKSEANWGCSTQREAANYLKSWLKNRFDTLDSIWK